MSISPVLKTPFTDVCGAIVSHQYGGRCADMEMRALDCLEAYGLDKGLKKCDTLIKDFDECSRSTKQHKRALAMRVERHRQHFSGERSKEEKYVRVPPLDSF